MTSNIDAAITERNQSEYELFALELSIAENSGEIPDSLERQMLLRMYCLEEKIKLLEKLIINDLSISPLTMIFLPKTA